MENEEKDGYGADDEDRDQSTQDIDDERDGSLRASATRGSGTVCISLDDREYGNGPETSGWMNTFLKALFVRGQPATVSKKPSVPSERAPNPQDEGDGTSASVSESEDHGEATPLSSNPSRNNRGDSDLDHCEPAQNLEKIRTSSNAILSTLVNSVLVTDPAEAPSEELPASIPT